MKGFLKYYLRTLKMMYKYNGKIKTLFIFLNPIVYLILFKLYIEKHKELIE
jgi:hypothetical protein